MSLQEQGKQFQRFVGRQMLIVSRAVISRLPYVLFQVLAFVFMLLGHLLISQKRQLAVVNLKKAFKAEKSDADINRIANRCFNNFGRGMIDLIYMLDRPRLFKENVTVEGREHLDRVLQQGKGAILVGAHFGNFIMMYFHMVEAGYKTNVIMKRTRDTAFEQYISVFRDERGLKTIYDLPARPCVTQCIKALRNNEVLFILLDQNYGGQGRVFVDFFGQKAATAAGPVVFANRTGAPILPAFMVGEGRNRHRLLIGAPIELEAGDGEDALAHNVGRLTKVLEQYIRAYPHEWGGWMHDRWKAKTVEEQRVIDAIRSSERREQKTGIFG